MTAEHAQQKDAIREQWSEASQVWGKWHEQFSALSRPATLALCDAAQLKPGLSVLDLAGGTGEPSITVAERVAPATVTYSDFAGPMVEVARRNAQRAGVSNMRFEQVDAEDLPFDDASFDRVVSRFGVMFFPDTQKALAGIRRVTKPGGRVAFVVWAAPMINEWFFGMMQMVAQSGFFTPPAPGSPGPFRFGEPGSLPAELRAAGFADVQETAREIPWRWPGALDEYMDFTMGTVPPVRRAIEQAEAAGQPLRQQLRDAVAPHFDGEAVVYEANVLVVVGAVG
jgi:ubiquinone/menaquinone biosynthesis C-methylase UbiE